MPILACSFCLECLSKHASVALYCGHSFHESCLRTWFAGNKPFHHEDNFSSKPCPTCRQMVHFNPGRYYGVKLFFHVQADETTELENRILELDAELKNYKKNAASVNDIKEANMRLRESVYLLEKDLKNTKITLREVEHKYEDLQYSNDKLENYIDILIKARNKALKDFAELSSEYRTVTHIEKILNNKIPADMERLDKPVLCKVVIELQKQLEATSKEARIMKEIMQTMHADLLQKNKEQEEGKRSQHSKRKSSDPDNSGRKKIHVTNVGKPDNSEDDETLSSAPKASCLSSSTDALETMRYADEVIFPADASETLRYDDEFTKEPKTFSSALRLSGSPTPTSSSYKSSTSQPDTVRRANPIRSTHSKGIALKPCKIRTTKWTLPYSSKFHHRQSRNVS